MAKLVLNDIDSLANTASAKQALNENFTDIEAAIENTLSRNGATPNQMQADIDMNSNDLLNVQRVDAVEFYKNGVPFEQSVAYANKQYQLLSGTGAQTQFTLLADPGSLGNLYVSVGGSDLKPGIDYNYDGTTITFVVAPAAGTNNIYIRYDVALATEDSVLRQDLASSASGKGAALAGFLQAGTGAVARTVASKLGESVSIADFGGVGDDVADNAAAFAAAEASPHERIYLPQGTYYAAGVGSFQLTKFYYGPGTVRLDGPGYTPGRFTQLMTSPMKGGGTDANYYFSGDTSRVDPEYFVLGSSNANVRQSLTEQYFESTTTPHFEYFVNYSGGSGGDARMTVAALSGATTVTVAGTGGLAIGNTIGFNNVSTGLQVHTATITNIVGNDVSFTPGLPLALDIGSTLARGTRTMQQFRFTQLNHLGQGDAYCQTYRVTSSYVPLSGQDHFFYTSTAGVIGGDISHGTNGCYSTTFEFNCNDGGKDVAHIAFVESFNRNFVGSTSYGAVWLGTFFKSEGAGYADAAHVVSGKWKRGLDTVLMSPNADKAAINMGPDQRIYFDSTATADPKLGLVHYGDTIGDTYIEYNTAAGALVHFTNGAPTLHLHPAYSLFFNNIVTQGSVAVPTNGKFYLEDNNSDTYLTYNGTNILLVKNGATVATW